MSLILALAGTFTFAGCAPVSEDNTRSNNAGAGSQAGANGAASGNTAVVTNGMVVPAQPADANVNMSGELASDGIQQADMIQKRNKARPAGGSAEKVDAEAIALQNARPAPDNSTFTSYLAEAGYEIRTFKDHPQLSKVEKRTESNGNQTIRIILRDGRIIQRPGSAIPILSNVSAAAILAAGGIDPPQPRQQHGPAAAKKPSGN